MVLEMLPEIILSIFLVFGLISNFNDTKQSIFQYYRWCIFLVIVGLCIVCKVYFSPLFSTKLLMGYIWINCYYTSFSKLIVILLTLIVLFISRHKLQQGMSLTCMLEFPIVVGFSVFFIFLLTSSYDFFGLYLAIEGLSLTLYTMASMLHHSIVSIESSIKYYVLGALSTGIMLFGISGLYGLVGSLDFLAVQVFLGSSDMYNTSVVLKGATLCILFGFFFKMSAFPCHIWVADVYEGVWTPVTAFFAIVVKLALLLVFLRVMFNVMFNIMFSLQQVLIFVSIGSIWVGAVGALKQVRVKRFIAYTSINQVGFILLGVSCCSLSGLITALIYLILYVAMSVGFFTIILNLEHIVSGESIMYLSDLYTLTADNSETAKHLVVLLVSMSGLPPFGGFIGKFIIYFSVIEARLEWVVFLCMFISVITTYYYLSFIRHIFFWKNTFFQDLCI